MVELVPADEVDGQKHQHAHNGIEEHESDHVSLEVEVLDTVLVHFMSEVSNAQSESEA